jgi:hypothetical protein
MDIHDANAPLDRCAVCGKPAAALTANRRCTPCRAAEVQRNRAASAAAMRAKKKRGKA